MGPTLSQIRQGLADTIHAGVETHLHTYAMVQDVGELPALIIEPDKAVFDEAMNGGLDCWEFALYVLVPHTDAVAAQRWLDALLSGAGPDSIRAAVWNDSQLGVFGVQDSCIQEMHSYGGGFNWFDTAHVGAILKARVMVNGQY